MKWLISNWLNIFANDEVPSKLLSLCTFSSENSPRWMNDERSISTEDKKAFFLFLARICLFTTITSINSVAELVFSFQRALKIVNKFIYLRSSISSSETDINTRLAKAGTAIDRLSVIWRSDLTNKIKRSSFQAAVVSILLYECTTWTLNVCRKSLTATTQECCKQYWTSPGVSALQSSSCTATYHPPRKLSKLDEPDMQDIAGEVGTTS